jgi:hypothetical protein
LGRAVAQNGWSPDMARVVVSWRAAFYVAAGPIVRSVMAIHISPVLHSDYVQQSMTRLAPQRPKEVVGQLAPLGACRRLR